MSKLAVHKGIPYEEKRLCQWLEEDGKVVLQVKRDEIRCVVEINHNDATEPPFVTYTSASGKPLYNLSHFDKHWLDFSKRTGRRKIDCGVSVNDSFDLTRRTVMASKKQYDLSGNSVNTIAGEKKKDPPHYVGLLRARFWLYDIIDHYGTYEDRRRSMAQYALDFPNLLICPETFVIHLDQRYAEDHAIDVAVQDVESHFQQALDLHHEGLMIKRFYHSWEPRRTTNWMKMKPEAEVDVEIIGYVEGKGEFAGLVGSLIGRAADGSTVDFSGFTLELRRAISADFESYRGRWCEVRYMQRDAQGGYRHPRFFRFHPDK
ncbi:ATP-dependent DNA ligase [Klebsiella phage vB_Kpl_K59PH2]|uniref:ATP-dependent DNA ligase n=1 Tax=Klebsiella phage vB_Kpl_K59PH2 TaxID=3071671 RepID=A0AAD2JUF3_9CAUD|nr:ATP-dependent DNA ligase [Klebsiella phage vB_Kpl_K59PH2]